MTSCLSAVAGVEGPDEKSWTGERGIELRHLRYFVSVAEHLHFGRAARALHIAQPSLSRQIRDLEYHLGVTLLERGGHRFSLTREGKLMLEECYFILAGVSASLRRVRRQPQFSSAHAS